MFIVRAGLNPARYSFATEEKVRRIPFQHQTFDFPSGDRRFFVFGIVERALVLREHDGRKRGKEEAVRRQKSTFGMQNESGSDVGF
jgi:hypothetical protein